MKVFLEQDLRRALAPARPDPDEFLRAVRQKLAERGTEGTEVPAGGWRQAAAVLPVDLLAPAGVPLAALAKKLGLGGGLGLLTWPVVSLAMLALAFVAALRSVLRAGARGAAGTSSAEQVLRAWWRTHALQALCALGLVVALAWTRPAETVLLVLLLSMGVVTLLVTRLAGAGAATRASVGEFTAGFLGALLGLALICAGLGEGLNSTRVAAHWAPTALVWGCLVCDVLGRWKRGWSWLEKLAASVLPTAVVVLWIGFVAGRAQPADREGLQAFVERPLPALEQVTEWQRCGRVGAWLLENGVDLDRSQARRALEAAWERSGSELFDGSSTLHALTAAARLELLPAGLWTALADDEETREVLVHEGSFFAPSQFELRLRALARVGLTEAQREHLSRRLAATWPRPEAAQALETMAAIAELAELIGRPLTDERRPDVQQALWMHWRGADPSEAFGAPFSTEPCRDGSARLGDLLYLNATHAALELIGRFGAEERLDLARVRAFLEDAARPSLIELLTPPAWPLLTIQGYRYDAAVALRELEHLPGAPARSRPNWHAKRVLLATFLLVGLCIFTTLWAGLRGPQRPSPA